MAKTQKKTGKGRLDKYYKLAKEQGYRARSAFKLIQLNKKYGFLESARCCIDLCAAPGGWLQVASKQMPVNSIIVGIDLVPIKPIPRVVTFAADITTPKCRNLIRGELKDWKADVVLHDGAPNVGTAWVQDAYSQSELVLMSLKLAVEFLIKGGTFVTKVFRSADYNNLIWVFNQLFARVEATKPPSSRNVSAEIFVVCRDFLAPKFVDPKFLDPKHVFKDLSSSAADGTPNQPSVDVQATVFQPAKTRRKRDGYADGDYTLFKALPVSDFVKSQDPISILGTVNRLTFSSEEEKAWIALDITTEDVMVNCEDLKVLGKGDFKSLIRWRIALRQELGLEQPKQAAVADTMEVVQVLGETDDDQMIQDELERLNSEAAARQKRDRRRANEKKSRAIQRMQLQMTAPMDIGMEQHDPTLLGQDEIYIIGQTKPGDASPPSDDESLDGNNAGIDDDDDSYDENEMEDQLDNLYDAYQTRLRERDTKFKVKESRKNNPEREEWHGIQATPDAEDEDDHASEGGWERMEELKANSDLESSSEEEDEDEVITSRKRHARAPQASGAKKPRLLSPAQDPIASRKTQVWFSQDLFSSIGDISELPDDAMDLDDSASDDQVVDDDIDPEDVTMWDMEEEQVPDTSKQKTKLTTAEAVTLAQQLVNRQKTRTELINAGFNRYSLNSKDSLPSWFLDDEAKHYKSNIPVTKEAVAALRAKQRALDSRPIKKVAEAKARKKYKAAQRLEKAMKKAEGVNATSDLSEREKAQQIEKLMRKGTSSSKKKKEVKLVVAKGSHKGIKGRPKGVKGRYVMVDSRMKKEVRAKKRKEKAKR